MRVLVNVLTWYAWRRWRLSSIDWLKAKLYASLPLQYSDAMIEAEVGMPRCLVPGFRRSLYTIEKGVTIEEARRRQEAFREKAAEEERNRELARQYDAERQALVAVRADAGRGDL